MTIKVNNQQLEMLVSAVKDGLWEARSEARDYFYTGAPDCSGKWADLYRILRSIHKHQKKQTPTRHWGRIAKRRATSVGRRLAHMVQLARAQEELTPIDTPNRWDQLKQTLTGWLNR
jgi:hypothetical protein